MIYLLDTNVISDWTTNQKTVAQKVKEKLRQGHTLVTCPPVYYEVQRGLFLRNYRTKLHILNNEIMPRLWLADLTDVDWLRAGRYWADATVRRGRKINDVDLLVAALAHRLSAVIVSSDKDFDELPVNREDWRQGGQS